MGRECKGACLMMANAHGSNRWRQKGRRYCSLCDVAFDPPSDEPYECECCTGMTRISTR